MKVHELIAILSKLPHNYDVLYVWDGEARSEVHHAFTSKGGYVVLADQCDTIYSDKSRPLGAPDQKTDPYWNLP